jgi:hypothetical protein
VAKRPKLKTLQVVLPQDEARRIIAFAKRHKTSVSRMVRRLLNLIVPST